MSITAKDIMVAREVLGGRWGNGDDRKTRLKNAGYDPSHIQGIVNRLAKGETVVPTVATTTTTTSTTQTDKTLETLKTCLSDIEKLSSYKELIKLL